MPFDGKSNVVFVVAFNTPSAPVLPELNCARAVGEAMRQSPIVIFASVIGFIIRFLPVLENMECAICSSGPRANTTRCADGNVDRDVGGRDVASRHVDLRVVTCRGSGIGSDCDRDWDDPGKIS